MVKVARVRLNVIGQDGVGKTCLVRLLFGQRFEEQPSTCGLNLSKAVTMMKSHAGTVTGKWQLLNHKEHREQLNNTFRNARTNERGVERERVASSPPSFFSRFWRTLRSLFGFSQSTEDSRHEETKLTEEHLDEIEALISEGVLFGFQDKVTLMTICDFGGQEPFLAAHVALMPPGALSVYMLVFNGAKLLADEATSSYRKLEGEIINPIEQKLCRMETNGDFLKHWASSVHIAHPVEQQGDAYLGEAERVEFPAVFRVATHRWKAEEAADRSAKGEASAVDFIRENNEYLKELFLRQACQCHFVRPSSGLGFFLVENKTSGTDEEDPTADEIRSRVDTMTDDYWAKQKMQPARWLKFEGVMGKLARITGRSVLRLDEVKQVAEKCHIFDEEELKDALLHLTHVGAVYYFPDVPRLENVIFHDSDWLFKLLVSFVGSAHSKSNLSAASLDTDWDVAVESGFLSLRFVNYLLSEAEVKERDYASAKSILCHFDVLVEKNEKSESEGYYAPCFLQDDFTQETKYSQAFIQKALFSFPLIVYAKDVLFFPEALFFRLATRLIRKYRLSSDVPLKRNRLIFPLSPGVNAEFLYQGSRNCVSLTVYAAAVGSLTKKQKADLSSPCSKLCEWLIKNVNDAKQRGMAGLQTEFYCQLKKTQRSSAVFKSLAPMKGFSKKTRMWTLTDGTSQLNDDELRCMKLWLGAAPRMISLLQIDQADGSDLDGVVSKEERRALAKKIRSNWRHVGEVLKFEEDELDGFEAKRDDRDRAQAMLDAWAERNHEKATRRMLILALKEEDYGKVISEIFNCNPDNVN
ncbi:uncharacterized protein [Oscarella lobularis]